MRKHNLFKKMLFCIFQFYSLLDAWLPPGFKIQIGNTDSYYSMNCLDPHFGFFCKISLRAILKR